MTAFHMVNRARIVAGERVIIPGASGGVGLALVQLCKLRGAFVIAIASAEKVDDLLLFGIDQFFARDETLFENLSHLAPVHVVLDVVAGPLLMPLLNSLLPRGLTIFDVSIFF